MDDTGNGVVGNCATIVEAKAEVHQTNGMDCSDANVSEQSERIKKVDETSEETLNDKVTKSSHTLQLGNQETNAVCRLDEIISVENKVKDLEPSLEKKESSANERETLSEQSDPVKETTREIHEENNHCKEKESDFQIDIGSPSTLSKNEINSAPIDNSCDQTCNSGKEPINDNNIMLSPSHIDNDNDKLASEDRSSHFEAEPMNNSNIVLPQKHVVHENDKSLTAYELSHLEDKIVIDDSDDMLCQRPVDHEISKSVSDHQSSPKAECMDDSSGPLSQTQGDHQIGKSISEAPSSYLSKTECLDDFDHKLPVKGTDTEEREYLNDNICHASETNLNTDCKFVPKEDKKADKSLCSSEPSSTNSAQNPIDGLSCKLSAEPKNDNQAPNNELNTVNKVDRKLINESTCSQSDKSLIDDKNESDVINKSICELSMERTDVKSDECLVNVGNQVSETKLTENSHCESLLGYTNVEGYSANNEEHESKKIVNTNNEDDSKLCMVKENDKIDKSSTMHEHSFPNPQANAADNFKDKLSVEATNAEIDSSSTHCKNNVSSIVKESTNDLNSQILSSTSNSEMSDTLNDHTSETVSMPPQNEPSEQNYEENNDISKPGNQECILKKKEETALKASEETDINTEGLGLPKQDQSNVGTCPETLTIMVDPFNIKTEETEEMDSYPHHPANTQNQDSIFVPGEKRKSVNEEPTNKKKKLKKTDAAPRAKSVTVQCEDDLTPKNWRKLVQQRQGGASAGKFDVYYFSPSGKKLRSKREVLEEIQKHGYEVDTTLFSFTHSDPSKPSVPRVRSSKPKTPKIPKLKASSVKKEDCPNSEKAVPTEEKPKEPKSKKEKTPRTVKSAHFKISTKLLKPSGVKKSAWLPPKSPFKLFQEFLYHNPWQLLVGTILLNKTQGSDTLSRNILFDFVDTWKTPESLLAADSKDLVSFIKPLGLADKKVKTILRFTGEFLNKQWTYPKELHGIGKYGNDSYRIFCVKEWRKVKPTDFYLIYYVSWLCDNYKMLDIDI